MNLKTILAFAAIIAGLTLVIAPSVTVLQQQALAFHAESDAKADAKATKANEKGNEEKVAKVCGGSWSTTNPIVHCLGPT